MLGTLEQFLLHVQTVIHACKQNADFAEAERAVEATKLDADIAKTEYAPLCNSEKKTSKGAKEG